MPFTLLHLFIDSKRHAMLQEVEYDCNWAYFLWWSQRVFSPTLCSYESVGIVTSNLSLWGCPELWFIYFSPIGIPCPGHKVVLWPLCFYRWLNFELETWICQLFWSTPCTRLLLSHHFQWFPLSMAVGWGGGIHLKSAIVLMLFALLWQGLSWRFGGQCCHFS